MCITRKERSGYCGHLIAKSRDSCELRGTESFCKITMEEKVWRHCESCRKKWRENMGKEEGAMPTLGSLQWTRERRLGVVGGVEGLRGEATPGEPDARRPDGPDTTHNRKIPDRKTPVLAQEQEPEAEEIEDTTTQAERHKPYIGLLGRTRGAADGQWVASEESTKCYMGKCYVGLFRGNRGVGGNKRLKARAPAWERAPGTWKAQGSYRFDPSHKPYKGMFAAQQMFTVRNGFEV